MFSPITFIKEVKHELDQVKWPLRNDVIKLTIIVIIASLIAGLYIGGLDYVFKGVFEYYIANY